MSTDHRWEDFRTLPGRGAAEALCAQIELAGVPARIEARLLENGIQTQYCVVVGAALAHRARWILAQLPPSDEELNFLATGRLPGHQ